MKFTEEELQELREQDEEQNKNSKYADEIKSIKPNYQPRKEEKEIEFTPLLLLKMEKIKDAIELLAKEILKKYIIHTTRDDDNSECWIYEDGIFKPEAKTYIKE